MFTFVEAPENHKELKLPNKEKLPEQGSMFIGEKGRLLLLHFIYAKLIVDGKYEKIDFPELKEADFINLIQADKCETILEIFINDDHIMTKLEIGEQDLHPACLHTKAGSCLIFDREMRQANRDLVNISVID